MASKKEAISFFFLMLSYSVASKRQRAVINVRKQLEYLESLIYRNTFNLREDLFQLQEQVNATAIANAFTADLDIDDFIGDIKREIGSCTENLKALANGLSQEKKFAANRRVLLQEELRSIVENFHLKFEVLENKFSNMERDFEDFKVEFDRTISEQLDRGKEIPNACPLNGFIWKASCYVLDIITMNWTNALDECKARGGQLAILESEEEMRFVLPKLGQNTWVGGNDAEVEGVWRWTEKEEEIKFLLWEPGQPNGTGDCLEAYNGLLNDERCAVLNKFVCEYTF